MRKIEQIVDEVLEAYNIDYFINGEDWLYSFADIMPRVIREILMFLDNEEDIKQAMGVLINRLVRYGIEAVIDPARITFYFCKEGECGKEFLLDVPPVKITEEEFKHCKERFERESAIESYGGWEGLLALKKSDADAEEYPSFSDDSYLLIFEIRDPIIREYQLKIARGDICEEDGFLVCCDKELQHKVDKLKDDAFELLSDVVSVFSLECLGEEEFSWACGVDSPTCDAWQVMVEVMPTNTKAFHDAMEQYKVEELINWEEEKWAHWVVKYKDMLVWFLRLQEVDDDE